MPKLAINVETLRRITLFSVLGDENLKRLASVCRHRRYERACTILDVGKAADGVYVLLAGRAKVVIEDAEGRQVTLAILEANQLFGEGRVFDESEGLSGVTALTACEALYIPKRTFLECVEGNFDAAILILRGTLARLRRADRKIASLGLLDVYSRVARLLTESANQVNGRWVVDLSATEIACSVAASREMVSRVLKKMKSNRLVRREKRKTIILDWAGLTDEQAMRPAEPYSNSPQPQRASARMHSPGCIDPNKVHSPAVRHPTGRSRTGAAWTYERPVQ